MRPGCSLLIIFVLLFTALPVLCAEGAGLGESLLLEGRLALLRGETWMLSQQNPDGSWQSDSAVTAQAGMLLANSDIEYYAEQLQKTARWLQDHAKNRNSAGQFAQALRLSLRLNHPELTELVKDFQSQKAAWDLQKEPFISRQWLLEAHFLLPQELTLLSAKEVQQFQQDFLQEKDRYPALALLTILSCGSSQVKPSELEVLRSACVKQSTSADPEDLFWIVRAMRASERFLPSNGKIWRSVIVSRVLEKQSGQGAFIGRDSAADLSATVFYLQILQLCLAP